MTDTALATTERPTGLLAESVTHFAELVKLKSAIMKDRIDYGTIRGCGNKPALLKPGAEKVLHRFSVHTSPADTTIEDLSTAGEIRYRITIGGRTPDGIVRGFGIGECSTREEKYAWRKAVSGAEFEDTSDSHRRIKYYADGQGQQVRSNPADQANTVLKMAKKRAMVDLALTSCAASQFFTQDVEDLPAELRGEIIDVPLAAEPDPVAPHPPPRTTGPEPDAERPPDGWPVNKRVLWYMQRLGLTGEAVTAAAAACKAPENSDDWSEADGQGIIEMLHKPPPEAAQAPEPAPAPAPSQAAEDPKARTRRTKCKGCEQMIDAGGVVKGLCPACRGPEPTHRGQPCKACSVHTPLELLHASGTCPKCTPPAVAPGASAMDSQFASGKPDQVCARCNSGPHWPASMTLVEPHGLVCGECVVVLGMAGKEPPGFACISGCGAVVEVEGGKCPDCALPPEYRAPAKPAGPDDPPKLKPKPTEIVTDAIRKGVDDGRFTSAEGFEALKAAPGIADNPDNWDHHDAADAVTLLDGLDCRVSP